MQLHRLFKENKIEGILGVYPLTPENLIRVGLALCTVIKIEKDSDKPTLSIDDVNFLTISISLGFMYGGGNIIQKGPDSDISVRSTIHQGRGVIYFDELKKEDIMKIEAILFSRYNIPKQEGEKIGSIWIQNQKH